MSVPKIFESEYRFCLTFNPDLLKEGEDINEAILRLVELCREKLGWSKATTYTVIKRLSQRGVLKNEDTVVTSLVSKEEVQAEELDELVDRVFEGNLPSFVAAFTRRKKLSQAEVDELRKLIDSYGEDEDG